MSGQQATNQRPRLIINDYTQNHPETKQPFQGAKFNGQAYWALKNNGRIVLIFKDNVWVNNQASPTRELELSFTERGVLFDTIRQAASNDDFVSAMVPVNQKVWIKENGKNKRSDTPVNIANIVIARNPEGEISMEYVKGDYKMQVFFAMPNAPKFKYRLKDGSVIEDSGRPSQSAARGWCNKMEPYLNKLEEDNYQPRVTNTNAGNGGGNNWPRNNNGGGNGGYNGGGGGSVPDFNDDEDF